MHSVSYCQVTREAYFTSAYFYIRKYHHDEATWVYQRQIHNYNKVDHDILPRKLNEYSVIGNAFEWLRSYLTGRYLLVRVDGHISNEYEVTFRVPQGSHLGPILFNIFVNDIGSKLISEYLLYADDLKIFRKITGEIDVDILQNDFNEIHNWCQVNKLNLSIKKCAVMSFSWSHIRIPTGYFLGDQRVQEVSGIKDLGIVVDNKLTFAKHVDKVTLQAFKTTFIF